MSRNFVHNQATLLSFLEEFTLITRNLNLGHLDANPDVAGIQQLKLKLRNPYAKTLWAMIQ